MFVASFAAAQETTVSPHGRLPDGLSCLTCHRDDGWTPLRSDGGFDHNTETDFALDGQHTPLACLSCHEELRFDLVKATTEECETCHANPHTLALSTNCASCHSSASFTDVPFEQAHWNVRFELLGVHETVACETCHEFPTLALQPGIVAVEAESCLSCHQSDYDDGHGTRFPDTCLDCHSQTKWDDVFFDHTAVSEGFELVGSHELAACESCHSIPGYGLVFSPGPSSNEDCLTCHQADYDARHGAGFSTTCLTCHNQSSWSDASFDHSTVSDGFALVGAHEIAVCASCHVEPGYDLLFSPAPSSNEDCLTCHQSDYDTEHGGGFPTTCLSCHNQSSWSDASFDHSTVSDGFALVGAHEVAVCASCHVEPGYDLLFSPAPSSNEDCLTCHQSDYDTEHGGGFPTTCLTCHNQTTWSEASFDHASVADGFALVGAHEIAVCASCHVEPGYDLLFSPAPSSNDDCFTCHQADYDSEHDGQFPTTCIDCHNQTTWSEATFDHTVVADGFALIGAHEIALCASCHVEPGYDLLFSPAPSSNEDCLTCHQSDYDTEHGGGFPTTCLTCHNQSSWSDASFDHTTVADGFALIGAHEVAVCASCHVEPGYDLLFSPAPSSNEDCLTCHQSDYDTEHGGGFPTTCLTCHNQSSWSDASFDHTLVADGFALIGAHEVAVCASCHVEPGYDLLFSPAPSSNEDCLTCHQSDYDTEHGGGFPTTCLSCHNQTTWSEATFDHTAVADGFALIGAHEVAVCASCHVEPGYDLLFSPAPSSNEDCLTCHQSDYDTEHGGGFPTTCLSCHNQSSWSDASFDHSDVSDGFALVGAHEIAVCASCHVEPGYDLLFSPAPSSNEDCLTCHQSDYDAEHGGGFPTTCLTCHNQTTWSGASFNHTELSDGFQLIGAHEVAACESCHSVPGYELVFSPAPAGNEDCLTCHQSDYDNQHGGSSFPTTCLTCHNQVTWEGATFSHPDVSNGFELIGAHEIAACESCHTVPGYDLIFSPPPAGNEDCITCHQAEYTSEHGSSGFPTTCLTCHNQTTWEGATFDHDALYFPIYSGTHRSEWNQCADCHRQAPITYATFSCIDCHEHRQSKMDDEHRRVNGYVWDSIACLSCHPDGRD